jgi:hypothetical protein
VRILILSAEHCWVFLDDKLVVEWACKKTFDGHELVLNSMATLEAVPIEDLIEGHRLAFRSLVAEGLARHLLSGHTDAALAIHRTADDYVRARLRELARTWYLWTALIALGLAALFVAFLSVAPPLEFWRYTETHRTALLCLGFGAIGASSSLITRIGHFSLDPAAGRNLHRLEAIARVGVGAIGAVIAYLAIRANFILPAFSKYPAGIFLLAFVAGASERFVPTLIEKVEIAAGEKKPKE